MVIWEYLEKKRLTWIQIQGLLKFSVKYKKAILSFQAIKFLKLMWETIKGSLLTGFCLLLLVKELLKSRLLQLKAFTKIWIVIQLSIYPLRFSIRAQYTRKDSTFTFQDIKSCEEENFKGLEELPLGTISTTWFKFLPKILFSEEYML